MCQRGIKKIANIFAFGRFSAWARIYNRFVFFTLDVLDVGITFYLFATLLLFPGGQFPLLGMALNYFI